VRRLREKVGSPLGLTFDNSHRLRGRVTDRGFDVRIHSGYRTTHYHLRGRFGPDANGTRIGLSWGMGDFDRWVTIPFGVVLFATAFARAALQLRVWPFAHQPIGYAWLMVMLIPMSSLAWVRAKDRERATLVR